MTTCAANSSARSGRVDSASSLRVWLERAAPGAAVEYHRGFLAVDRATSSALPPERRARLAALAGLASNAAERGKVILAQRRLGPSEFSYLAIKAAVPTTAMEVTRHAA